MGEPEVMNVAGAAAFLQLHRSTVSRMVAAGRIPHRMVGRVPRFSRTVLIRWLEGQDDAPPPAPTAAPTGARPRLTPKHVGRRQPTAEETAIGKALLRVAR